MYYHIWFVTKYRKSVLKNDIEVVVKSTFADCIQRHKYEILALETNNDHVHMLVCVENRIELAKVVRTLKAVSAREILNTPHYRKRNAQHFWARRYGYKKIEPRHVGRVKHYIQNQKKIPHTGVCGGRKKIPHTGVCGGTQ
jgi:putative transposase